MSLISSEDPLVLAAVLVSIVALGLVLERTRFGQQLTGATIILVTGMTLANLGVIPLQAPIYGGIISFLVPIAIPLLLFKADLRTLVREGGPMVLLFMVGAVLSVGGTFLAMMLLDTGPEEAKIAGTFAATYIGGSMNLVAVSSALGFEDLGTVAATLAADNVVGTFYLITVSVMSGARFLQRFIRVPENPAEATEGSPGGQGGEGARNDASSFMLHITIALACSGIICVLGVAVAEAFGVAGYGVLFITFFAVAAANVAPRFFNSFQGDFELGTLFMYMFFAVVGASTDLSALIYHSPLLILFAAIIVLFHLLLILPIGRLLGYDLAEILIASNACIAGPATAAALSASRGWSHLVVPGIMCGVFGYVIANFVGVSIGRWGG